MNPLDIQPPAEDALVQEMKLLRREGIAKLSRLKLPALTQAVRACGRAERTDSLSPYAIERLLRDVVVRLGGDLGDTAATILGLGEGGRSARPSELRKLGQDILVVGADRFRQHYEPLIFSQLAQLIMAEIYDYRLKLAQLRADTRTPVGTRLAVEWLHRFEAMYAIWSPVSGVGNELTGYRSTLLEEDRPWDRAPDPETPGDEGYSQEIQAAGYVTEAFYWYTRFLSELQDFETRFGGLWLLPDAQAETDISVAVHRMVLAGPHVGRDDSYMRGILNEVPQREMHGFLNAVKNDRIALMTHDEWQEWTNTCECEWEQGTRAGREYFPTHLNNPGIDEQCDLHILIAACNDFCLILDDAWDAMADWYRDIPRPQRVDVSAEEIYARRDDPLPPLERARRG